MLNKILFFILTASAFVGFGCSAVTIKGPLDIEPVLIEEIEGTWSGPSGDILLVKNYGENKVMVGGLEWNQHDCQWDIVQVNLVLAHDIFDSENDMAGGLIFLNLNYIEPDHDLENQFLFGRYLLSDSNLVVWYPDKKVFDKLVESGEIKGNTDSGFTTIQESVANLTAKVKEQERTNFPDLFGYKAPLIYKKIGPIP